MNTVIIKAGGVGSRMGAEVPKQFICVDEKPIIIYTMEVFEQHPGIDEIYVVCVKGWEDVVERYAKKYNITKLKKIVEGGETSLLSIKNGVDAVREDHDADDIIMIHDANRPCVTKDIISDVLVECKAHGMAVAAIPCNDEVAVLDDVKSRATNKFTDHKKLFRIQTPDAYKMSTLANIFDQATDEQLHKLGATNVLAIQQGYEMHLSMGLDTNIRLTTMEDIVLMTAILKARNRE